MTLSKKDSEFRLSKICYLDFKQIEMDRVLTAFFARLEHKGYPSRLNRREELKVNKFADEFLEHPEWFSGFENHRDIVLRWIETHLMDVVSRGKPNQAIAAPRPLHGFTYRFRNTKHSRDYGMAQHLYETLYHARNSTGAKALEHLYQFFFQGHDKNTETINPSAVLDVETQALLRLSDQVKDTAGPEPERFPPLCIGSAELLAEDIQRLLFYQSFIPRSVMVDYLKILMAFHTALYLLRLFKLLPRLVTRKGTDPICASSDCPMNPKKVEEPQGDCPYQIGLFVDVIGQPGTEIAALAERSADTHYRRIPPFIRAYTATKKLDEFAEDLSRQGRIAKPSGNRFTLDEVLRLLGLPHKIERDKYFGARLQSLLQDIGDKEGELDPELKAISEMGLEDDFESYCEMLMVLRGDFHRSYIVQCLDSLLLKNRPGALVTQQRFKGAPRRFILDSRLLEVLLQIAVLQPGGVLGYHTGEMRIEEVLRFLRERYGLYIDQIPKDSFGQPSISEQKALRGNVKAFISRLREIGFYRDLSDAYISQTVTPRYKISADGTNHE